MSTEDSAVIERSSYRAATSPDVRKTQFIEGVRAMTPFMLSAFPMGLLGGAFGITSGLSAAKTMALAMIVNSGTVQFVGIKLFQQKAGWLVVLMTGLVLSLRLLIYSTMLRPQTRSLSQRWRLILGFGLIDAVFFVVIERFKKKGDGYPGWQWYYVGTSAAMYINWMVATVIGILIGGALPDLIKHGLDFPMTAVFAGMLASTMVNWKVWAIVLTAGILALLTASMPYNLGLIVATLGGSAVGVACDLIEKRRVPRPQEA